MQKQLTSFFKKSPVNGKRPRPAKSDDGVNQSPFNPPKKRKVNKVIKPRPTKTMPILDFDIAHKPSVMEYCKDWLVIIPKTSKKAKTRYRCKICSKNEKTRAVAAQFGYNQRVPGVAKENGIEYKARDILYHGDSTSHKACVNAEKGHKKLEIKKKIILGTKPESLPSIPASDLEKCFSKSTKEERLKVTELFYEVYTDAKKITPTVNSLPSRRLARKVAEHVNENFNCSFTPYEPTQMDTRYNNPSTIKRVRSMIAEHGNQQLYRDLTQAWACWHVQDGSVDLRQRSNEFHMVAFVDWKTGKLKEGLTKIVEKPTRGAVGQIKAFEQCIVSMLPKSQQVKPNEIWELFRKDRENHLEELRTLSIDEEIYTPEEMPAQGFDDVIDLSSVLDS